MRASLAPVQRNAVPLEPQHSSKSPFERAAPTAADPKPKLPSARVRGTQETMLKHSSGSVFEPNSTCKPYALREK